LSILNNSNAISTGGGYNLEDSLRFRRSASAYLSRTPTTSGNRRTWTWSGWIKGFKDETDYQYIFQGHSGNVSGGIDQGTAFRMHPAEVIQFYCYTNATFNFNIQTTRRLRDPASWYHIVIAVDTTQATASNRIKIYVNGQLETALDASDYPAQNYQTYINHTNIHYIGSGKQDTSALELFLDGYLTEVNHVDGQALAPTEFGEYNQDTGVWQPKRYGGSYGTNGYYLDMSTSSSTVLDQSSNSNNWTATNMNLTTSTTTTYDKMKDVPTLTDVDTANFCTLNPLNKKSTLTLSDGNLKATGANASYNNTYSTFMIPKDVKTYFEVTVVTSLGGGNNLAFYLDSVIDLSRVGSPSGAYGVDFGVTSTYYTYLNGTSTNTGVSIASGHTVQMAIDQASGKMWIGVNNTWFNSGNPSAGTNSIATISTTTDYFIRALCYNSGSMAFNFGQQPFKYTPPTGFKKLNTYNLTDSAIPNGSEYVKTILWTGNSVADRAITVGFKPNMVWLKARSNAGQAHHVVDTVRGVGTNGIMKTWFPNNGDSEATDGNNSGYNTYYGAIQTIDANGFTVDKTGNNTYFQVNNSGWTYQAWNWKTTGNSPVSNTNGTITTTVSANPTSGISIMTYTGNGSSGATIGHGLGAKPYFVIIKDRSAGGTSPTVYHENLAITSNEQASLNSNSLSNWNTWNNTRTNTTTITLGNDQLVNKSGDTYVAYAFAPIEGFSKFGQYTGNGSSDGTFVYTGFRPAIVIWKRLDVSEVWAITDTAVNPYNVINKRQYISYDFAELVANRLDILSNGFKLRDPDSDTNASGGTYIYMAWAENPFKNALAR